MGIPADRVIAVRTVKTVYRDGETVLKVFLGTTQGLVVMREAMNQTAAYEAGLAVPRLCEVTEMDGKWTIRSQYLRGKTLRQMIKNDPEKAPEYMRLLASIQAGVHRVKEKKLFSLNDKMIRRLSSAPITDSVRDKLLAQLSTVEEGDTLCHGEMSPSNIIISSDDGRPYILDWAHAARGNAALDAAMTYVLLHLHENAEKQCEEYLHAFCIVSDLEEDSVRRLLPIAAASVLSRYSDQKKMIIEQFLGGMQ